MPRYFIEVAYKGTGYSGFQIQQNAITIQAEVGKVLGIFYKVPVSLTGSSRTDSGVHARQNFFHCDIGTPVIVSPQEDVYHLNAMLPGDIVVKNMLMVKDYAHCRFDASSRAYRYYIYDEKNPFLQQTAYFFPYRVDMDRMNEAAVMLLDYRDFTSFSKRNTQVKSFICEIQQIGWGRDGNLLFFRVEANRFLRGMVKGLVGTMLRVGRGRLTLTEFREIVEKKDCTLADFSVPPHGLFLESVRYDWDILLQE